MHGFCREGAGRGSHERTPYKGAAIDTREMFNVRRNLLQVDLRLVQIFFVIIHCDGGGGWGLGLAHWPSVTARNERWSASHLETLTTEIHTIPPAYITPVRTGRSKP